MLQELELKNFRQHRDLTVNFTEGLNVIRAANEQGKSTLFLAIAYAFWGSRALPESLEDTVTYEEPVGSLKVTLKFTFDGNEYLITRKKSGAELVGPGVTASGQAEVTAFMERLFKASYQVGFATVIANQGRLQDGIESGAVALIEKLSNMGLLDELVTHIQGSLPTGNTKVLENQIAALEVGAEPEIDLSGHEGAVKTAQVRLQLARELAQLASDRAAQLDGPARKADEFLREQAGVERDIRAAEGRVQALAAALAADVKTPVIPNIGELEAKQLVQAEQKEVATAWKRWHQMKTVEPFAGTVPEFVAQARSLQVSIQHGEKQIRNLELESVRITAAAITQDSCALCGKLLKDVPEVVKVNEDVKKRVAELQAEIAALTEVVQKAKADLKHITYLDQINTENQNVAAAIQKFVHVDTSVVPCRVSWTGPVPPETLDDTDYAGLIKQARAAEQQHRTAVAKREAAEAELLAARATLVALHEKREPVEDANAALEAADAAEQEAAAAREVVQWAESELSNASQALSWARKQFDSAHAQWQKDMQRRAEMQGLLQQMVFHNSLIKKLRDARPIVARELWNMVLSGVSQIFSSIRGTPSVVTRNADGFLVDGRSTAGLSGSTKDALGLANRVMLQKTFMGGIDFLLLDEPAAACDETREVGLLSAVTRADYKQVILVTHSDKADTFANNVIRF